LGWWRVVSGHRENKDGTLFDVPRDGEVIERMAVFSRDNRYRYSLVRSWDSGLKPVLFVGLNPSTADVENDDPTIRRCMRFARDWGYGGILMGNLFALRATDPREMLAAPDPVGERNDYWLRHLASLAGIVVAAWGAHGTHQGRAQAVVDSGALGSFTVLGLTKDGHPRHPLYMPAACRPLNPLTLAAA
jgi:hypothetical protein